MNKNTQKLNAVATLPEVEEVVSQAILVANLKAATKTRKEEYDAWFESLPVAEPGDVSEVVKEIRNGLRDSTSVPRMVKVSLEGSDDKMVKRVDKESEAFTLVETAIENRLKVLKSKAGRSKVDKTIETMTCVSFTLRTKKAKSGNVKAKANVRFVS